MDGYVTVFIGGGAGRVVVGLLQAGLPSIELTGDVVGTGTGGLIPTEAVGLLGQPLPMLETGFLQWNGTQWVFAAGSGGSSLGPIFPRGLSNAGVLSGGGSPLTSVGSIFYAGAATSESLVFSATQTTLGEPPNTTVVGPYVWGVRADTAQLFKLDTNYDTMTVIELNDIAEAASISSAEAQGGIAIDGNGNAWVIELTSNTLVKCQAEPPQVAATFPIPNSSKSVLGYDPVNNAIILLQLPGPTGQMPIARFDITAGTFGPDVLVGVAGSKTDKIQTLFVGAAGGVPYVFVSSGSTTTGGAGHVFKLDPVTLATEATAVIPGLTHERPAITGFALLANGGSPKLFISNNQTVSRIDVSTMGVDTTFSVPDASVIAGMAFNPNDSSLWATESDTFGSIVYQLTDVTAAFTLANTFTMDPSAGGTVVSLVWDSVDAQFVVVSANLDRFYLLQTDGSSFSVDAAGATFQLTPGTAGQVLTTQGAGHPPQWAAASSGGPWQESPATGGVIENTDSTATSFQFGNGSTTATGPTQSVALGGTGNTASGSSAATLGGSSVTASGQNSAAIGGSHNTASGSASGSFAGGSEAGNQAAGGSAVTCGGDNNTAGSVGTVGDACVGGSANSATGGASACVGGTGNKAVVASSGVFAGDGNTAGVASTTQDDVCVGGQGNSAIGGWSACVGGSTNTASGAAAGCIGGSGNTASGSHAAVLGGGSGGANQALGMDCAICGGSTNVAGSNAASEDAVVGGTGNTANGGSSAVVGGTDNRATSARSVVVGGESNLAANADAICAGGAANGASGAASGCFAGGGTGAGLANTASGAQATCIGGQTNVASGINSSCVGGNDNTASLDNSACVGGVSNQASAFQAVCVGGASNIAGANTSGCFAGSGNNIANTALLGAALGGGANTVIGVQSACVGGELNTTTGIDSTCVGGGIANALRQEQMTHGSSNTFQVNPVAGSAQQSWLEMICKFPANSGASQNLVWGPGVDQTDLFVTEASKAYSFTVDIIVGSTTGGPPATGAVTVAEKWLVAAHNFAGTAAVDNTVLVSSTGSVAHGTLTVSVSGSNLIFSYANAALVGASNTAGAAVTAALHFVEIFFPNP